MKITLGVLFLAGLTIYCKCAAVLSLPPSLITRAASTEKSLKTQKPSSLEKENWSQQPHLQSLPANEDESVLAADLYTNFQNLLHNNDLSLKLQKRERHAFDDDIARLTAIQQHQQQQPMATINKNNQNQNGLRPHDNNDNIGDKNSNNYNNNHNNNNKNENNYLESTLSSSSLQTSLPLSLPSAATNMNEATNLNLKIQPQLLDPTDYSYDANNEWLSSSPEMINDMFVSPPHQIRETLFKRRELENLPLATAAADTKTQGSAIFNRFYKPSKYWFRQCPLENENNCLQKYYGDVIADRKNALLKKQLQYEEQVPFIAGAERTDSLNDNNNINNDDIVLLLTAEQNLLQFLSWALAALYPYGKFPNVTDNGADYYNPGMYMWKKLNLSGRLEPPLLVQEPRYVMLIREYDKSGYDVDNELKRGLSYGREPFIPPRGRKHNSPDLASLLQRYETFVPNRGRRDKIKDIFKHDDLFYPNRGKRQMTTAANDNDDIQDERADDGNDINDIAESPHYYNKNNEEKFVRDPLLSSPNKLAEYVENLVTKMKRKLHPAIQQGNEKKLVNSFDKMSNRNEPTTKMSTTFQQASISPSAPALPSSLLNERLKSMINILHNQKQAQQHLPTRNNAKRQWWKKYTAAKASPTRPTNSKILAIPTSIRSPTLTKSRLQTTLRSMSPLQQLIQLYQQQKPYQQPIDLSPSHMPAANKLMWQQQQKSLAQQFDPLSWHKLQLLLLQQQQQKKNQHHRFNQPFLTMRHPRLTALLHLPAMQEQEQQLQLATPQETQLTYSYDQLDNRRSNDLDNF